MVLWTALHAYEAIFGGFLLVIGVFHSTTHSFEDLSHYLKIQRNQL